MAAPNYHKSSFHHPSLGTHQSSNADMSLLLKPKDGRPGDVEGGGGKSSLASPAAIASPSLTFQPSTIMTLVTSSDTPDYNPHIISSGPTEPSFKASSSPSILPPQLHSLKRAVSPMQQSIAPPAKKQSKWSLDEDEKIIQLRGKGMKWEDISKNLPGRSVTSCRLHYQNYLERCGDWDENKKNKLAWVYESLGKEFWSRVAEEVAIPWRAAEAMHWQMGEHEMARRTGVKPFTLANTKNHNTNNHNQRIPNHILSMAPGYGRLLPSMVPSSHSHHHFPCDSNSSASMSNSLPHSLSQLGSRAAPGQTQLPSLGELTAGVPALAPQHHYCATRTSNPANIIEAHSPSKAFNHQPTPMSLSGYSRPGNRYQNNIVEQPSDIESTVGDDLYTPVKSPMDSRLPVTSQASKI